MPVDIRAEAAQYYDHNPVELGDIQFYLEQLPSVPADILELGCGTGRVMLPLVPHCRFYTGVDLSQAMLDICQEKLEAARIPRGKAQLAQADITDFDLGRVFDLVIAPFRVMQNQETDAEVTGMFEGIRRHLAPQGTCILNVFRPMFDRAGMLSRWRSPEERLVWETPVPGGRIACYDRRPRLDPERMVLYPELIYRLYEGDQLKDQAILKIAMRCYYPEEFEQLILQHGFEILNRWGGYHGEVYGEGPELVIKFKA